MRILVTGACGWTAQAIVERLHQAGHTLIGFDLPGVPCVAGAGIDAVIRGTVADAAQVQNAMANVDVVVHLAVATGEGDYGTPVAPFATNVQGTYNVFEAALQNGIGRIVLMSEAAVHVTHPGDGVIRADAPLRTSLVPPSEHLYDLTKHLQETIARNYAVTYQMPVIVLRPGHIVDGRTQLDPKGRPLAELDYLRGGWVCRYDLAEAVLCALTYRGKAAYSAFHVVGAQSTRDRFDVATTERELGMTITQDFAAYSP